MSPEYATSVQIISDLDVLLVGTNLGSIRMYLWPMDINDNKP